MRVQPRHEVDSGALESYGWVYPLDRFYMKVDRSYPAALGVGLLEVNITGDFCGTV